MDYKIYGMIRFLNWFSNWFLNDGNTTTSRPTRAYGWEQPENPLRGFLISSPLKTTSQQLTFGYVRH